MFELQDRLAKSALVKCHIPGIDYVINPYIGCRFACIYCYASFMGRFNGKKVGDWGEYVFPKTNIKEVLKKDIRTLKNKGRDLEILMSTVTDPYQGVEAKYKLTRACLETLREYGFEGIMAILTKSDLVLRDVDILKQFKRSVVGVTVTSTNDSISRYFEKYAPPAKIRIQTLKTLNAEGISTYAFIGPLLPHFVSQTDELEKIFKEIANAGTRDVFVEHLNLAPYLRGRFLEEMKGTDAEIIKKFYLSQSHEYRDELDELVVELIKKYNLRLLTDSVIFHSEFQALDDNKGRRKM